MYDNIGKKIKVLAVVSCIIVAITAFIMGIVLMATSEDLILLGLLVMLGGPVVSWISSWILYGYGELIEKACNIDYNVRAVYLNVRGDEPKSNISAKAEAERLKKLENLRARGLITEEEYKQAIFKK